MGKDPYAYKFDRTHTAAQLQQQFAQLPAGQVAEAGDPVSVAGRVRARRFMGKLAFATLADDSGEVQLYLEKTSLDATAPDSFKYALAFCVHAQCHPASCGGEPAASEPSKLDSNTRQDVFAGIEISMNAIHHA